MVIILGYKKLGLCELKPTLQLADRSEWHPKGVLKDVLLQIHNVYFLVDFIVIDTAPVKNTHLQILVILGRPFLGTINVVINCKNAIVKLYFEKITFELASNQVLTLKKCKMII